MVTARHAALRPGAHVVAAVHGVLGKGRRLRVMMTVNRAFAFRTYSKRPSREPRMLRQGARTLERPRLNSPSQGANAAVSVTWTSWIVHAGTLKRARREHPQNGFRRPGPCGTPTVACSSQNLDLACPASQTRGMAHAYGIYIRFDFGTDEEKAQQARHKLDRWRQAFRLDKRVQYKMDRPESAGTNHGASAPAEKPATKAKEGPAAKTAAKAGSKSGESKGTKAEAAKPEAAANGQVGLLVRLYFSPHERLSEQRWLARIPAEEPFKSASPKVIHQNDPEFEATDQQFESISQ